MKAIWNGKVIAESDDIVEIEGRKYFPDSSKVAEYFKPSESTSQCAWKGTANYYDIEVDGKINKNACWYYANPSEEAVSIKGRVAFWMGVEIEE